MNAPAVVLASASATRTQMLTAAGVVHKVAPAAVDEEQIKRSMRAEGVASDDVAAMLAELKASRVSARVSEALVIGADQMLDCEGQWFDKPPDRAHARAHLQALRGRSHRLVTAACVALNGSVIWRQTDAATLTMRHFSDAFLDAYVAEESEDVCASVGAYRIEGRGIQLFARIQGSHFTILGLPLLALLDFLRQHGVVAE